MHAAYLVLTAKRGRQLAPHHRALVERNECKSGLYFQPNRHVSWLDHASRLAFGGWQLVEADDAVQWYVGHESIAMYSGYPLPRDTRGDTDGVAPRLAAVDLDALQAEVDELVGVFSAVSLKSNGAGRVIADPLAQRFVYYGETADVFVVSSQATLVAQTLSADGHHPARDTITAAALAYHQGRIGDRSGFKGVSVMPPGATIELKAGENSFVRRSLVPWLDHSALKDVSRPELLDMAREEITAPLASVVARVPGPHLADLTGGRDSRLVLATILSSGLRDRFVFDTAGPPDLADVRVASEIAREFGLSHRSTFEIPDQMPDFGEMIREFVAHTAGVCSIWEARPTPTRRGGVRVSGANGECLRAQQVVSRQLTCKSDLAQMVGKEIRHNQLGLVRPDLEMEFARHTQDLLLDDPFVNSEPLDLLDNYHFLTTARKRYGPLDELQPQPRVLPLYSIRAIRIAFALGGEARQAALIHFETIRDTSELLAKHPFAGQGWSEHLLASLPNGADYRPAHKDASPGGSEPLFARLQRSIPDDRKAVFHDLLQDRDNLAWHVLDRAKAEAALVRYGSLSNTERKELFGAVTAALWLGDYISV